MYNLHCNIKKLNKIILNNLSQGYFPGPVLCVCDVLAKTSDVVKSLKACKQPNSARPPHCQGLFAHMPDDSHAAALLSASCWVYCRECNAVQQSMSKILLFVGTPVIFTLCCFDLLPCKFELSFCSCSSSLIFYWLHVEHLKDTSGPLLCPS